MPVSLCEAMFESKQNEHEQNRRSLTSFKSCCDEHCHSECTWQSHRKVVGKWTIFSAVAPPKGARNCAAISSIYVVHHVHVAFFSLNEMRLNEIMFCDCMAWDFMKSCFCKALFKLASGLRNWRHAACTDKGMAVWHFFAIGIPHTLINVFGQNDLWPSMPHQA